MKTIRLSSIPLNFIGLYALGYTFFLVPEFTGTYQRGFYCDDESITKEFKENTISIPQLLIASILACFITVTKQIFRTLLVEWYISLTDNISAAEKFCYRNVNIPPSLIKALTFFGYSHIGFIAQLGLIQVPKYSIGRLRPHFLDVCQPAGYNCAFPHQFVTNYTCAGTHTYNLRESRLSFFSGHAATALFTIVFLSASSPFFNIYLESRLSIRGVSPRILRSIQISLLAISLWVCHTRLADNFHHPTDVLTGIVFGIAVSHIAGLFTYKKGFTHVENPQGIKFFASFVVEKEVKTE